METIPAVEAETQVSSVPEVQPARKVGIEVVRSANVSRRFFSGPRPGRRSTPIESELSTHDRVTLLRAQLRLLRLRAEIGIFVSPDSIARAERIASSLEAAA